MEDHIYIISAKVLQGEASDADRSELDEWLQVDKKNQQAFIEMQTAWQAAAEFLDTPQFNTSAAWQKVAGRINLPSQVATPRRRIVLPAWAKYSAAIAALLVLAFFIRNAFVIDSIRVIASTGNERIELPDHSIINLRKGSSISYPRKFSSLQRHVVLEGQAFFEVTHNEAQPFVVDGGAVSVTVLGTTFDVDSDPLSAEVTVTSGRVRVAAQSDTNKKTVVTPGSKAHYEDGIMTRRISNGYETAWMSGTLPFNNEPFDKVLVAISTLKDTVVQMDPAFSPARKQQLVTVTFHDQGLQDMLTELCLITHSRWEKNGNSYLVRPK